MSNPDPSAPRPIWSLIVQRTYYPPDWRQAAQSVRQNIEGRPKGTLLCHRGQAGDVSHRTYTPTTGKLFMRG